MRGELRFKGERASVLVVPEGGEDEVHLDVRIRETQGGVNSLLRWIEARRVEIKRERHRSHAARRVQIERGAYL
jgi:hypothetical protein